MTSNSRSVISCLPNPSPQNPYSSLSSAGDGRHLIAAGKDALHILRCDEDGLHEVNTIRISQFFQAAKSTTTINTNEACNVVERSHGGNARDRFGSFQPQASQNTVNVSIVITDVAWSLPIREGLDNGHGSQVDDGEITSSNDSNLPSSWPGGNSSFGSSINAMKSTDLLHDSLIAAAGSNGVVVVWRLSSLIEEVNKPVHNTGRKTGMNISGSISFFQSSNVTSVSQPEAVLVEHSRAVNRLVWHHRKLGLLITASQDSTVKLFERRQHISRNSKSTHMHNKGLGGIQTWLGNIASSLPAVNRDAMLTSVSWHCISTFTPRAEAIRDVQWSPFDDNVFSIVTDNGFLILYDIRSNVRPIVRIAAHTREATSVDWHPTCWHLLATGGVDRTVKVWDLESGLVMNRADDGPETVRFHNQSQQPITTSVELPIPSSEANLLLSKEEDSIASSPNRGCSGSTGFSMLKRTHSLVRSYKSEKTAKCTLSVVAPVTRLLWRPPSSCIINSSEINEEAKSESHHEYMLAVATTPVHGANAAGSGSVALWSLHRPFMPLSVVEGHEEGAVTDFIWIDTPTGRSITGERCEDLATCSFRGFWQHIISVGKDGRCLLQSLARGERPISQVPPSTFALANLSPFQRGYGSLQIISASQNVPSGYNNDFALSGLRQDEISAVAPGVFREIPPLDCKANKFNWRPSNFSGQREPSDTILLTFSATDWGELDTAFHVPVEDRLCQEIRISPEVMHLSRFADSYQLRRSDELPTKASVCRYNSIVAKNLRFDAVSRMWNMLATLFEAFGSDNISKISDGALLSDAMSYLLPSTIRSLLLERADAGDIQTCVAICEVIEIVSPLPSQPPPLNTVIPGIDIFMVREWYLSYIDILQQMCLFAHATELIKNCKDQEIRKLNQQSTIIHEACPTCLKPLQGITAVSETDRQGARRTTAITTQRVCSSCRQKVGFCFVCHERVDSLFVWCSGCGHGGHIDCALEWFGGGGKILQELCPTGCGHRCNMLQQTISFPRTDSLLEVQSLETPR